MWFYGVVAAKMHPAHTGMQTQRTECDMENTPAKKTRRGHTE